MTDLELLRLIERYQRLLDEYWSGGVLDPDEEIFIVQKSIEDEIPEIGELPRLVDIKDNESHPLYSYWMELKRANWMRQPE